MNFLSLFLILVCEGVSFIMRKDEEMVDDEMKINHLHLPSHDNKEDPSHKLPSSLFLSISFQQPHFRLKYFMVRWLVVRWLMVD